MAEELGRINKPEAEQFKKGRRLFLVPLVFGSPVPSEELKAIVERYWQEALSQVKGLEARIGHVKRIYHEMVALEGETGLTTLRAMNTDSHGLVNSVVERGASLMSIEDHDLLNEFMDWGRCLSTGLYSQKVLNTVLQSYQEALDSRNKGMAERLDKSLGEDEIGLLIVTENHRIQFPSDIEVFYITPPALDEYKRWLRQQEELSRKEHVESQEQTPEEEPIKAEESPKAKPATEKKKPASSGTARKPRKKKSS